MAGNVSNSKLVINVEYAVKNSKTTVLLIIVNNIVQQCFIHLSESIGKPWKKIEPCVSPILVVILFIIGIVGCSISL